MKNLATIIIAITIIVLAGSATAATITAPTVSVAEGSGPLNLQVLVSGGELFTDMVGFVQLGDGGTIVGGTDTAEVTSVDLTSTVWDDMSSGVTMFYGNALTTPSSVIVDPQINANATGEYATAAGVVFNFTVDISDYQDGDTIPILLSNSSIGMESYLINDAGAMPTTLVDGMITVTPEPATMSLLGLGGLALLRRRSGQVLRRRRRK